MYTTAQILSIAVLAFAFNFVKAQSIITDNDNYTPQDLATSILQGSCANIFNVTYIGNAQSIGYFSNGSSIGISDGVLLTTGNTDAARGPNDATDATFVATRPGDFDLEAATGVMGTQDA